MSGTRVGLVLVHGFLSSPDTWDAVGDLVDGDPRLATVDRFPFRYLSRAVVPSRLRRLPNINNVADSLGTYLRSDLRDYERLVLVSHSQGGLVVQRFLARTLAAGRGLELARIRQIIMFACPNSGSELALSLREASGWIWSNAQEKELRPLAEGVLDAQRIVLDQVVYAKGRAAHECRIPIMVYAGESDGIVTPQSARSVFPDAGVLPGDHFEIIQPDSHRHRSYVALSQHLMDVLAERPRTDGPPPVPPRAVRPPAPLPIPDRTAVVNGLLAVPRMMDPTFRLQLYDELPRPVAERLRHDGEARTELFALVSTFHDYWGTLRPWEALLASVEARFPGHPAVDRLRTTLEGYDLVAPPASGPATS